MSSASGEACGFADEAQQTANTTSVKKKRNLPGTPDPHAEVIALSPKTLMATNRFSCEVCGKGFQRDQNLQLHRRGHNLPWKLKQREGQEIRKKVYVCPEVSCVHHDPSRALGDLTGIKKHFSRKHGEKKWKCDKCSKKYAVHSDWKAHQKVCGTREYRCDCGTLFSRRDSFITHRAFCDALAEESARVTAHKQVESQQSGGHEEHTTPIQTSESTKPAEASESPHPPPSSRPSDVEASEASTTDALRPESCSVDAGCVSPLTSKWMQEGKVMKSKPSKVPALSLSLGTGPGPGPPCALQMGCSPRNDVRPPPFADVSKVESLISEIDERMKWPDASDGMGSFTSMLTSGNSDTDAHGYGIEHHGGGNMAGLSVGGSGFIGSSSMSHFTLPPPRSILPDSSFGNGYMPPKPAHHTGSGQLPATALLQKAAMMGATTTNPYFYRNYGSSTLSAGYGQDSWAGPSVSNSWAGYSNMQFTGGARSLDQGHMHPYGGDEAASPRPMMYGGQGGVQAFMNSFRGGGTSMFKSASFEQSYGSGRAVMPDVVGGTAKLQESTTHPVTLGLRGDGYESSRTTLDFLGIGGRNSSGDGVVGVTMTGNSMSLQRTMSGGNVKMEPVTYDGNMKGKGVDQPPTRQ